MQQQKICKPSAADASNNELFRRERLRANLAEISLVMQDAPDKPLAADSLPASGIALEVAVRLMARPLKRHQ